MKRKLIALALFVCMTVMMAAPVMGTLAAEAIVTPSEPSFPEFGEMDETQETEAFAAAAKATYASVFAGEGNAQVQVKAEGGAEPYALKWKAFENGAEAAQGEFAFTSEEIARVEYMPGGFGTVVFQMIVTDANGAQAQLEAKVEAAVRETEDKSAWEAQIAEVELTGDWAEDMIAIAMTQLGYKESERNFVIEGGQKMGYTRYGARYSVPYAAWCTLFARFVIEQAQIDEADYPQDSSCFYWVEKLTEAGTFAGREHTPAPGDLFFINLNDIADPDHMGIVAEVGEVIRVIEGNSEGNDVRIVEYEADDERIVGYGLTGVLMDAAMANSETAQPTPAPENTPAPEQEEETEQTEEKENENALTGLTVVADVNIRKAPSTDSERVTYIHGANTAVTVLGEGEANGEKWYAVEYEGHKGYIRADLLALQDLPADEPTDEPTEGTIVGGIVTPSDAVCICTDAEGNLICAEECKCACHEVIAPDVEVTAEIVYQPWQIGAVETAMSCAVEGAVSFNWQRGMTDGNGEIVWEEIASTEECEVLLVTGMDDLKYSYRCVATLADESQVISAEITLIDAELVQWMNEVDVNEEMLARAMNASSLESLMVEGGQLVHVRTSKVLADVDIENGAVFDRQYEVIVGYINKETMELVPANDPEPVPDEE